MVIYLTNWVNRDDVHKDWHKNKIGDDSKYEFENFDSFKVKKDRDYMDKAEGNKNDNLRSIESFVVVIKGSHRNISLKSFIRFSKVDEGVNWSSYQKQIGKGE